MSVPERVQRIVVRSDLTSEEEELLARAELLGLAPAEAWTADGTSAELAWATHGAIRWFGKLPPPVVRHLVLTHSQPGDLVWDPMCGAGTTGVECALLGRRARLRDVSPLSLLAARVKTRRLARADVEAAAERVAANTEEEPFEPVGLRNAAHWFLPETARSLRRLRTGARAEPDPAVREAVWLAFAATIRRVSRAGSEQGRIFLDAASALEDAAPTFARRAAKIAAAVGALPDADVEVSSGDLRHRPHDPPAPLVVLHPPYFNNYRYSGVQSLELAWLGYDHRAVNRGEVREFFKVGVPENAARYVEDMHRVLANAAHLVTPGGVLALVIGDTVLREKHLPITRQVLDGPHGLRLEGVAVRVPRFTEASWVASQRRTGALVGVKVSDFILTLRKPA